jgi:DNA-binding transcriptional regulator GbsR (MarR family)
LLPSFLPIEICVDLDSIYSRHSKISNNIENKLAARTCSCRMERKSKGSAAVLAAISGLAMEAPIKEVGLTALETEVIDIFVRAVQVVGLPKSLGEIYGLLYASAEPLSMDGIMRKLRVSLGTASQGLKQLRSFRAVRTVYVPGERKDFYEAETEFRKLAAGFFREEVFPQLETAAAQVAQLRELLADASPEEKEHYRARVEKLDRWQKLGSGVLRNLLKLINF